MAARTQRGRQRESTGGPGGRSGQGEPGPKQRCLPGMKSKLRGMLYRSLSSARCNWRCRGPRHAILIQIINHLKVISWRGPPSERVQGLRLPMITALDRLLAGSSAHCVERQGGTARLSPHPRALTPLVAFQEVVALAQSAEWHGYRIHGIENDGTSLPVALMIELVESTSCFG